MIPTFLFKGSTYSSGTGPTEAFTGLYYKYTEASSPRIQGDNAILDTSNYKLAGNLNRNKNKGNAKRDVSSHLKN